MKVVMLKIWTLWLVLRINDERARLRNARKLLIYVGDDDVFQRLRWKFVHLDFDYLEVRSFSRYCQYANRIDK